MNDLGAEEVPVQVAAARAPLRDWRLIALGVLFACGSIGAALAPYLVLNHPLILLALAPWPRHMILVAPHTELLPFVLVTTLRGFLAAALGYEMGMAHGESGMSRLSARSERMRAFLATLERIFKRAAIPILLVAPGPLTAALAGASRMRRLWTFPPLILGQAAFTYLNYRLGDFLRPYTAPIMAFLQRYLLEATLVCAAIVVLYQLISRRRRLRKLQERTATID